MQKCRARLLLYEKEKRCAQRPVGCVNSGLRIKVLSELDPLRPDKWPLSPVQNVAINKASTDTPSFPFNTKIPNGKLINAHRDTFPPHFTP